MSSHLDKLELLGVDVHIIADPRQVVIDCHGSDITDGDLRLLSCEPDLVSLSVRGCAVSNSGLQYFSNHVRLAELDIGSTKANGNILEALTLPNMRGLVLSRLEGVSTHLHCLFGHQRLNHIDVSHTDVTSNDIIRLIQSTNVTGVDVQGTCVSPELVASIDDVDAEPCRTVVVVFGPKRQLGVVCPVH